MVFVHLLDGDSTYLTNGDFAQSPRKHSVERGAYWSNTTTISIPADQLARARMIGVGIYDPYVMPQTYTFLDGGPRDSGGARLLIPIADGTGRMPPREG